MIPSQKPIVLAGNPNVGKSVVFNALTGQYVDVSNYPGTTIEILKGNLDGREVIDTPGVYGISSFNDEERIARDVILGAGTVINVVNAARLRQDLFLTLQLIDTGLPVIVALNMMDEAAACGYAIDVAGLSRLLGVPVVPCTAVKGCGIKQLKTLLPTARPGLADPVITDLRTKLHPRIPAGDAMMVLEGDEHVAGRYKIQPGAMREELYRRRRVRVDQLANRVLQEKKTGIPWHIRLGRLTVRPLTGFPILAAVLAGMFYMLGIVVAGHVVGFTEDTVMNGIYVPAVIRLLSPVFPESSIAGRLLVGEFGVLSMGVIYLFGLLLPLVVAFYLMLSVLEDSGYLPRMAVLADRFLTSIGLNGRAVIPIILGFGCVTMATITTRLLGTRRERFIATLLLGLAIPCSAQLGVIIGMVAPLGASFITIYFGTIALVFGLTGLALNRVIPGQSSDLLIELPPMRIPRLANIIKKTWHKSRHFLSETVPLFAIGSLLLGLIDLTGWLTRIHVLLRPLTQGWLALPEETATSFILGLLRRDFGAAGLTAIEMTPVQVLVALTTMTLFVPCIAAMLVIIRERGWREGLLVWFGSFGTALLAGGLLTRIMSLFS